MSEVTERTNLRPVDVQEDILAYTMPVARQGMIVAWYKNGKKRRGDERTAIINRVTPVNVDLYVMDPNDPNPHKEYVCHVSDPRLKIGQGAFAEFGAWDYNDQYLAEIDRVKETERRLTEIEGQLMRLQGKQSKKAEFEAAVAK
jgi:hypothetical protein